MLTFRFPFGLFLLILLVVAAVPFLVLAAGEKPAAASGAAETGNDAFAATPGYSLGGGDVIDVSVFEVAELSRTAVISPDGTVTLPLIGTVKLGGLTTQAATARLAELYGDNLVRNPQVSVTVKEYHSQPVSVLGAVNSPGVYQLRGARKLSDVVALAQGLSAESGGEISIHRKGASGTENTVAVSTRDLLRLSGREEDNPWVQGGDTVRVAKAGVVYVVGEVIKAGGFQLKDQEQITVLKAVSLAEGLRRDAAPQKARIIRKEGAEKHELPVKLRDILDGRAPDTPLLAGDILFVPNSQAKTAMGRVAEAAIQMTTGLVIWRF
jgi:polysaccharide export outer membrane protein